MAATDGAALDEGIAYAIIRRRIHAMIDATAASSVCIFDIPKRPSGRVGTAGVGVGGGSSGSVVGALVGAAVVVDGDAVENSPTTVAMSPAPPPPPLATKL
jgi:hypothetical protein